MLHAFTIISPCMYLYLCLYLYFFCMYIGTAGISGTGLSSSNILNTSSGTQGRSTSSKTGGPARTKRTGTGTVSSGSSVSSASSSSSAMSASRSNMANLPSETYVKLLGRAFSDLVSPTGQLTATIPCSQTRIPLSPSHAQHSPRNPASPPAPPSHYTGAISHTGTGTGTGTGSPSVMIASAFLVRGRSVPMSDFLSCVVNAQRKFVFPAWNQNACKIGLCSVPAPKETLSVLGIYNRYVVSCFVVLFVVCLSHQLLSIMF